MTNIHKFAHISDCHLGAHRNPVLRKLESTAFEKTMNKCVDEKVDFIIISGDLFHSNIPNMAVVNEAVKKMKEVRDEGIRIYLIYGSHDYSPNETSIVDILDSTGLFSRIVKGRVDDGKLKLEFTVDPETKARLVGMSGRKIGMEQKYFEILDRESLEKEEGFKIFVFHSAVTEFKPDFLARMTSIPISYFPKEFDYYAGGHVHRRIEEKWKGFERVVYPGPIFAGYPQDLEQSAKGEKRGFYMVSFEDVIKRVEFVEIPTCEYSFLEYDASNKNSTQAQEELQQKIQELNVANKVVLLRIRGELSGGKTSDINFSQMRKTLVENGALHVNINRFGLASKEYTSLKVMGEDVREIESKLLKESIGAVKVSNQNLKGEKGSKLALELLDALRQAQKPNETKKNYGERMVNQAIQVLELNEAFK
ncbi:MAG: DNA repair exonuclease [Candidatus Bathyarchaeota archaeon]|nr:MAG: DNA repair exonuclease [Candidatus Bathyarchaeota archaeon]